MPDTHGTLSLPLIAVKTQRPVGQLKADYLLATPVEWSGQPEAERMETTFVRHWKRRRTLEVGHRGSGESFTKLAMGRGRGREGGEMGKLELGRGGTATLGEAERTSE